MIAYKTAEYPNTLWALSNLMVMNWNEGFTGSDVEDIAAGIKKVATLMRKSNSRTK